MEAEHWYLVIGILFIVVTLTGSLIRPLPITLPMLYLGAGLALGPMGLGSAVLDGFKQAKLIEILSELAVVVSLFTAGLKLRCPIPDARWKVPLRLAFLAMAVSVGLVAILGMQLAGLSIGAAIILGAVLAPTDPVLASDVQLESALDQDRLRFGITGEAGLNDGTAFPFLMLGIGLLGLHDLGTFGWRWLVVDMLWAIPGGLAIGATLGTLTGHLVLYLRRVHQEGTGWDDFLALGLIALSYGAALLAHAYGFLAVFAAGLALRNIERRHSGRNPPPQVRDVAAAGQDREVSTDPQKAPAYMAEAVLASNQRTERLLEVAMVMIVGFAYKPEYFSWSNMAFAFVLFLVIRPVAVFLGLLGVRTSPRERLLTAWFGIRGIGSIYYLSYAIASGLNASLSHRLAGITFTVIALSIIVHGLSVTPLMRFWRKAQKWPFSGFARKT